MSNWAEKSKDCTESVLEMLYMTYREFRPRETPAMEEAYGKLSDAIRRLSLRENDAVMYAVCDLCTEHERAAFQMGIRLGAQLMLELNE